MFELKTPDGITYFLMLELSLLMRLKYPLHIHSFEVGMFPIIKPLSPDERLLIGGVWARRARREAELYLRFDSLFQALRAHQATPTVVTLAEQTSIDSQAHAEKYRVLADSFGVETEVSDAVRLGPLAPPSLSILDRIVYELVLLSCVEETLMGCLMGQVYQHAKHPQIRLTAHLAFQDEIWHSRLGWAHLGNVSNQISVSWLSAHVVPMLDRLKHHELYRPDESFSSPEHMLDYGVFNRARRLEMMREGVNTIILPGLESMGIDVAQGRQWSESHL